MTATIWPCIRSALAVCAASFCPLMGQTLPFFTETALTVGFEANAFRTFSRVENRDRLKSQGREAEDPQVSVFAQILAVPIRINSETVFTISAPLERRELSFNSGGARRRQSRSGLGDATLLVKRRIYQNDSLGGGVQAALLGGVKLPTGDRDRRDVDGQLLPAPLRLGTGSVDVPVGFAFTVFKKRVGFASDVQHRFNTEADGLRRGDRTSLNLALGWRLWPTAYRSFRDKTLNVYAEFNLDSWERDRFNGERVADSGGTVAYFSPAVQAVLSPRLLVEAAFQFPVLQKLNGVQLAPGASVNLGIRALF